MLKSTLYFSHAKQNARQLKKENTMQILIQSSFGTSYGWAWQIGKVDARGQTMVSVVSTDGGNPHSVVFFPRSIL